MASTKDRGYSWVVAVVGALLSLIFTQGMSMTGVFMVEFVQHFEASKARVSWINAIILVMFSASVVNALLFRRFGIRRVGLVWSLVGAAGLILSSQVTQLWMLYITYGVITGAAISCYNLAAVVSMPLWFENRLTMALGIVFTGSSVGVILWPPLVSYLIEAYSWRGALIILSGVHLNCLVLFALIRPSKEAKNEPGNKMKAVEKEDAVLQNQPALSEHTTEYDKKKESTDCPSEQAVTQDTEAAKQMSQGLVCTTDYYTTVEDKTDNSYKGNNTDPRISGLLLWCNKSHCRRNGTVSVWSQPALILFFVASTVAHMGYFLPYAFLPLRAEFQMYSKTQGALLVTIIGVVTGIVRPIFGFLGDKYRKNRVLCYNLYHIAAGICSIASYASESYISLCIYAVVFSIFTGGYIVLAFVVIIDMFGKENMEIILAFMYIGVAVSGLVSSAIAGAVMDATGQAATAFAVLGVFQVVGAVLSHLSYVFISLYRKSLSREVTQTA